MGEHGGVGWAAAGAERAVARTVTGNADDVPVEGPVTSTVSLQSGQGLSTLGTVDRKRTMRALLGLCSLSLVLSCAAGCKSQETKQ